MAHHVICIRLLSKKKTIHRFRIISNLVLCIRFPLKINIGKYIFRARNKIIFRFVETPQNSDFLISTRKPLGIHEPMLRGFVTNIMQLLTNIALEKYPFMQNTVVLWQRRINNNLSPHLLHYHHVSHVPNVDSKYKRNGNNKITYISNRHVLWISYARCLLMY